MLTMAEKLSLYLNERRGQWIDGKELSTVAGGYAWRTRVSDLRRSPYSMSIENRQRVIATADGRRFKVSEYRTI